MRCPDNIQAAAHPGQPPSALLGAELFHPDGDGGPCRGVREELAEKLLADVVTELRSMPISSDAK